MGNKLVEQPNGLWAIFSSNIDNFIWDDLNQRTAFKALVFSGHSHDSAWSLVHEFPDQPQQQRKDQWLRCIETIAMVYGEEKANNTRDKHHKTPHKIMFDPPIATYQKK